MGALADNLAALKTLMRTVPGFADRVSGPRSAPQFFPWCVVRGDRGSGQLGPLRVMSHRFSIFVLYGTFDHISQEEAEALAVGHFEAICAVLEINVNPTESGIVEGQISYEIGLVPWGGQSYYGLVVHPGIETKEEVPVTS